MFALMIGAMFPIIHLGRPWLAFWLFPYPNERLIWPNFRSPLVWDFFAINTYLTGSVLFLLLPMIPDFAVVRDKSTGWRKKIYKMLALGWRGTPKQWHRLETAMSIMASSSFRWPSRCTPSCRSTSRWRRCRCGRQPSSARISWRRDLQRHRRAHHRDGGPAPLPAPSRLPATSALPEPGQAAAGHGLLWGYFVFNERLVTYYGNEPSEMAVFWQTQREDFAPLYWTMVVCNFVLPLVLMGIRRFRTITGCVIASLGVIVGMWLERFLIIVPSLGHKLPCHTVLAAIVRSRSRSSSPARPSRP